MSDRRHFLKQLALLGTVAASPFSMAWGQNESPSPSAGPSADGQFSVIYENVHPKRTPQKITIPDVGEYKVLKGDFHIHTVFSDGSVMPQGRVAEAVDNGLDVIAITDHIEYRPNFGGGSLKLLDKNDDFNIAYDLARPEAEKQNLILVRGTEITKNMPPGHLNALFLENVNPVAAAVDDWKKMLAIACDQGGFIQWNHPNFPGFQPGDPMRFMDEHETAYKNGHLHGIEIFNGSAYYPIVSQWCEERNLATMANSDIHASEWNTYGEQNPLRPMTLIFAKERSHDSVKEAFFARRMIGFAAGMVLGPQEWLSRLFTACVTVNTRPGLLELINKSDIPCQVQAGGAMRELPAQERLNIYRSNNVNKFSVMNWLVGMNQPLEITLE